MTTESRPQSAKPFAEWSSEEISAESRRNREYWLMHAEEFAQQFPQQRVIVYDGGTVVGFSGAQEYFDFLFALDEMNQRCRFKAPMQRPKNTHRMSSAHQQLRR